MITESLSAKLLVKELYGWHDLWRQVKLQSLEDDGHFRNGWLICTRGKSFAVYAATATEKQEWMAHIDKCVRDLISKGGKKPASDHAAVWVPDSEATNCMICKKTQFSLVQRRVSACVAQPSLWEESCFFNTSSFVCSTTAGSAVPSSAGPAPRSASSSRASLPSRSASAPSATRSSASPRADRRRCKVSGID